MPTTPKPRPLTKALWKAAHDPQTGEPIATGPRCFTCGDLAAWGTHPGCQRDGKKRLMLTPAE